MKILHMKFNYKVWFGGCTGIVHIGTKHHLC